MRLIILCAVVLISATGTGVLLERRAQTPAGRVKAENFLTRTIAWWVMVIVFGSALALGRSATLALFGLISFQSLREFVTLAPTRRGDHRALFWVFFVMTPLQYILLGRGWLGLALVMIPVYGFLFLSMRQAFAGDCRNFLQRTANVFWAAMICVYCVSAAPALLLLRIQGQVGRLESGGWAGREWELLVFLLIIAELDDVCQYLWGNMLGRHKLAPSMSPNKTVEGFLGGVATVTFIGVSLAWLTPFTRLQAAGFAAIIAVCGTAGGLVMSAIKRDAGVKDYGSIIAGHGGMMDRVDSLTFAAPVFFHLVRFYFSTT